MIDRILAKKITKHLDDNKAIVVLGARQIGKTTLFEQLSNNKTNVLWLNADNLETRNLFDQITVNRLKTIIGDSKYIIIDEAQRIDDIGIKLKLITDQIKSVKLLVTGSSSLELANYIVEPLTGRKWEYKMYPLSFNEMVDHHGFWRESKLLEQRMIYGYYPDVVTSENEKEAIINNLASDYLYKDILSWGKIKKSEKLSTLLKALAFQIGNEVSFNELSRIVGLDKETIEKYINLLEQTFVIFRLKSFSRNQRNELKKSKKFYFYDLGIRNALISNFNPFVFRNDIGVLWENFIIVERMKYVDYNEIYSNKYFWRTKTQQEIDYIEERGGKLFAYEFKWSKNKKAKIPKTFMNAYPDSETMIVTQDNYDVFLGITPDKN
ncbi:MAG: ATP-binding protein [Saprospiraceae bacterium]